MLSVPVELHGYIIALHLGQDIPGLHRAADAQVLDQVDGVIALFPADRLCSVL